MAMDRVAALLLAAGHSRRFGVEDKLLAPLAGRPLVAHAANGLSALALPLGIAVIRNPELAPALSGFALVRLGSGASDMSASLRAGVWAARAAGAHGVLVALADMPGVSVPHLRAVLETGLRHGAAASTDGAATLPPACFGPDWLDRLGTLQGDGGAGTLIAALPATARVPAPTGSLADIDRPGDLAAHSALERIDNS